MDYIKTLTLDEENLLLSKAAKDKTTVQAMLDTKLDQYLTDVRREAGRDVDTEITKKLATKTTVEKETLLATL